MCELFKGWLLSMDFRLLENKTVRYCTFRLDASEPEFALRLRNLYDIGRTFDILSWISSCIHVLMS